MSNRIQILSDDLADKIAAGEVIERPASVVKELVENAIDAGSTSIVIHIKAGGTQSISVEDNGMGMNSEDAVIALHRHATSKIRALSDLTRISTLGFRGEALPSIGAVSRLELATREAESPHGTQVIVQGGEIVSVGEVGRAVGTTVQVRHLFFNTPARRKFLKNPTTEFKHITRAVWNIAIAHPQVGFILYHHDKEQFRWPQAGTLKQRLQDMYGPETVKEILPLDHQEGGVRVSGWIGRPEMARSSRIYQFLFVNRRHIVSQHLFHAIAEGYEPQVPRGKYPMAVILLEVDTNTMDVNVHPAKREVRFADEQLVHHVVAAAVRKALGSKAAAPRWTPAHPREELGRAVAAHFPFLEPSIRKDMKQGPEQGDVERPGQSVPASGEKLLREGPQQEEEYKTEMRPASGTIAEERVSLWQMHKRYIIAQIKDGAVIIDQHAAHERVLYEMAKKSFAGQRGSGQQLLFPLTLELSFEELTVVAEALPFLQQLGFSLKLFGGNTVVVEAIPAILGHQTGEQTILDILDDLVESGKSHGDIDERMARSFACKTAIKDGDVLSQEEMNHLIDMLFATQNPYMCPHGRPTFIRLPLAELDKKFKR